MTRSEIDLKVVRVPEMTVAGVRGFVKDEDEIQARVRELRKIVGDATVGPPICLYLDRDETKGFDVQVVLPVGEDATLEGLDTWTLSGDVMLSTVHVGPHRSGGERPGIADAVRRIWTEICVPNRILVGDNPRRSVYREGAETHGEASDAYVTEIQISYHFPVWVEALRSGVAACAGEETAAHVVAGGEELFEVFDADRIRAWVREAIRRLDKAVPDERARACLMTGCAHRHPIPPLEALKRAYEEAGSLESFLARIESDKALYPPRIWREPGRPSVLYLERTIPYPEAREATDDPVEKRFHTCFCSMVKDAILKGEEISPTFCNCSAGWFVQVWEFILGRTLRVDVVEDVLHGAERCIFAIHLPPDLLAPST